MNKFGSKFARLSTLGRNGPSQESAAAPSPSSPPKTVSPTNAIDPCSSDTLAHLAMKVADSTECLKVIHQRSVRDAQQTAASLESQKQLADALGVYAQRLRIREGHDQVLVRALVELKDFILYTQSLREEMERAIHSKFTIPVDEFVRGELRNAKVSLKKCEKARNNYESCDAKVNQLNSKGKLNLLKVVEAEKERDASEAAYNEQAQETTKLLTEVTAKHEILTLEQLCAYMEEYKKFFSVGYKRVVQLQTAVKEYESVVGDRKDDFRSCGGKVTERVRVSPETKDFMDVDESLWENETDQRKRVLMQLLEDERLYCALLKSLIENYQNAMVQNDALSKKVEYSDISTIFADIGRLWNIHLALHADLDKQLLTYPNTAIGQAFASRAQELEEIYPHFVMSSSTREDALERAKNQSSNIRHFLKLSEEKDGSPLQILLSVPLGRILRYEQHLKRLLMLTTTSGPEYLTLSEAIQNMQTLQTSVEQSMEISDRLVKVLAVKNKLQGYEQPLNPLVDRQRRYVREGPLTIFQGNERKAEEHHFFLFNNLLIYSKKISNLLSQFQGDSSYRYVGTVPIHQLTAVRDLPDTETLRNALELIWPNQNMIVSALTPERKSEWKRDLSYIVESLNADRIFGIPLNELMSTRDKGREVPAILEKTINWLNENNSSKVEGLFRIPGMVTEIQHFRQLCDQGVEWDFPPGANPHTVAGLLKLWIRELPEPLMTFGLYGAFMATKEVTGQDESELAPRIAETRKVIGQMPQAHASALRHLMRFLADVARNCGENKMNAHNLAIVFAPNLLYRKANDPLDCSSFKDSYNVIAFLIDHYESLFQEEEKTVKKENQASWRPTRVTSPMMSNPPPAGSPPPALPFLPSRPSSVRSFVPPVRPTPPRALPPTPQNT